MSKPNQNSGELHALNSLAYCCTLTVASTGVADLQICQVVQEMLEIKGRQRGLECPLLFVQPEESRSIYSNQMSESTE